LVTPETSDERVKKLDELSTGFLYAVSSSSTTGTDKNMVSVGAYLERLGRLQLNNPVLVGFGIKDKRSFDDACQLANGAIIGTAFIKALETNGSIEKTVKQFISGILA
jgi:tryptophan synthase alpha chain